MPCQSERQLILKDLNEALDFTIVAGDECFSTPETLLSMIEEVEATRYLEPRDEVPKSSDWYLLIFPLLQNTRFRIFTRMDRMSFELVLRKVQQDPVFQNQSNTPQAPVREQLALALYKLGHSGSASGFRLTASAFGVSEGHVYKCTKRVIVALARIYKTYIRWPNERERMQESIFNDEKAGLIGAIGSVDGTDIVLAEKPCGEFNPETFFSRKKRYAIDLCAVVDSAHRIRYAYCGWPNSVHDARIWAATSIHNRPDQFFSDGEYLLGDSAYACTPRMITPFKRPLSRLAPNKVRLLYKGLLFSLLGRIMSFD